MFRNRNAPSVRLIDYAPPHYGAVRVEAVIRLDPISTRVSITTNFTPRHGLDASPPLFLNGEDLKPDSVALDGVVLAPSAYTVDELGLTLLQPPAGDFSLTIGTTINPTTNTKLMGLYRSNGVYCTQCEADGFRRISYFLDRPDVMATYRVRLEADKAECPVLLANGNVLETGDLPEGRHFAVWDDPHPKPCYLFALVGGDLGSLHDHFVTSEGRDVALGIYVEKGK
jgi:aminopeptidase N